MCYILFLLHSIHARVAFYTCVHSCYYAKLDFVLTMCMSHVWLVHVVGDLYHTYIGFTLLS